jgi:hypothetical protein
MAKRKPETDSFKEFLAKYKAAGAQSSRKKKPINTSKYTLMQQIKRFENFSHTESELELIDKEIRSL